MSGTLAASGHTANKIADAIIAPQTRAADADVLRTPAEDPNGYQVSPGTPGSFGFGGKKGWGSLFATCKKDAVIIIGPPGRSLH